MSPGESNCAVIGCVLVVVCVWLSTFIRFWKLFQFFETLRLEQSPIAHLQKFSAAFSDFTNVFLRKHIEEFVLTAPSERDDTGVPLRQIHVIEDPCADSVTYRNVSHSFFEEILFPHFTAKSSTKFTYYCNLLKEIVAVSICGLKSPQIVAENYVGSIEGRFPAPNRSRISLVEFLTSQLGGHTCPPDDPKFDSVTVFSNTLVVTSNGISTTLFIENFSNSIVIYREIQTGIYGFEESVCPECMICCDAVATSLLIPCGHTSTCDSCTRSFRDTKCPICRSKFSSRISLPIRDTRPPTIGRR